MFTSRAEYRLLLREGNADDRLTPLGRELGLLDDVRFALFSKKQRRLAAVLEAFETIMVRPDAPTRDLLAKIGATAPGKAVPLAALLRQHGVSIIDLAPFWPQLAALDAEVLHEAETRIRYQSYLEREAERVSHSRDSENTLLPPDLEYQAVSGLTREAVEKLSRLRPATLGQAGRIPGLTPAAVTCLEIHLRKLSRRPSAD
jgi:tRNA uridine 5-carboxymethylaminomethyl modification enzyme